MSAIGRILLATDLSSASAQAATQALDLARDLRAELLIVNVVDGRGSAPRPGPGTPLGQLTRPREAEARDLAARAQRAGVQTRFLVWEGEPGEAIVDAARSESADLIVVGSRGRGTVGRLLLGSVSEHVVSNARCPVLVARA